jgi:hypothetical protein
LYILQDENKYLYHYTRADTLVNHILPGRALRLSPYCKVDDPYESQAKVFGFYSAVGQIEGKHSEAANNFLNDLIQNKFCVGCFVRDTPTALSTRAAEERGIDPVAAMHE